MRLVLHSLEYSSENEVVSINIVPKSTFQIFAIKMNTLSCVCSKSLQKSIFSQVSVYCDLHIWWFFIYIYVEFHAGHLSQAMGGCFFALFECLHCRIITSLTPHGIKHKTIQEHTYQRTKHISNIEILQFPCVWKSWLPVDYRIQYPLIKWIAS